jgi:hypothetical protein
MATTAATGTTKSVAAPGGAWRLATRPRGAAWPLAAVVLCAAAAAAGRGGFTSGSQVLFAGLAALALALALNVDERRALASIRSPACLLLGALAILSVASALWTVGDGAAAVRSGLVVGGYAALVGATASAVRDRSSLTVLLTAVAVLAAAEAIVGLVAAGVRVGPLAGRIEGSWRPGGTFEYPPALALLQIAALPALLRAMTRGSNRVAAPAALGAALAGAAVALAASRLELALALLVGAAAICAPRGTLGTRRLLALGAVGVPVAAAIAARLAAGGYAYPGALGGDAARLGWLAAAVALPALAWMAVRRGARIQAVDPPQLVVSGPTADRGIWARRLAAGGLVATAVIAVALGSGASGKWVEPSGGFTHGRGAEWHAAVKTALDHPVTGAGAGAYAVAARAHQQGTASIYPHDLPLEAWAELGPLGLLLVIGLYASVAALIWRIRRHPSLFLVAPGVLAFMAANLVDWPWHLAASGAIWALGMGACLALQAAPNPRRSSPAPVHAGQA